MESNTENPIDTILFDTVARQLEEQIERGEKKRIFEKGEGNQSHTSDDKIRS